MYMYNIYCLGSPLCDQLLRHDTNKNVDVINSFISAAYFCRKRKRKLSLPFSHPLLSDLLPYPGHLWIVRDEISCFSTAVWFKRFHWEMRGKKEDSFLCASAPPLLRLYENMGREKGRLWSSCYTQRSECEKQEKELTYAKNCTALRRWGAGDRGSAIKSLRQDMLQVSMGLTFFFFLLEIRK